MANVIKNFTAVIYEISQQAKVFVPGYHPSLMYVVRPGAYPSGATFSFSPLGKAFKKNLSMDKHTSLSRYRLNYVRKKFNSVNTWGQCYKTFWGRNLQIFRIS
jgi:hypothetical protein